VTNDLPRPNPIFYGGYLFDSYFSYWQGMSMRKQSQTSKDAYKNIRTTGGTLTQYIRILGLLKRFTNGMTIAELNVKTGLQKSSISARIRELVEAKILKELPKRKQTTGGCMARPVALRSIA